MAEVGKSTIVTCLYCPSTMDDEIRNMPSDILRQHIAACHIDLPQDPASEPVVFACDGNAVDSEIANCALQQPYSTMAANDYVDHMKVHHTEQNIPRQTRFKAMLSDFMAELSVFDNQNQTAQPSLSDPVEYRRQIRDYVLYKKDSLPDESQENSGATATVTQESLSIETKERPTTETAEDQPTLVDISDEPATPEAIDGTRSTFNKGGTMDSTSTGAETSADKPSTSTAPVAADRSVASMPAPVQNEEIAVKGTNKCSAIFTSTESKAVLQKLHAHYCKKSKNNVVRAKCAKCGSKIAYKSQALINHAMRHLSNFVFACKLCDHENHNYAGWYGHFKVHAEQKSSVKAGAHRYSEFYIDRRREMEKEIVQVTKECFLP